jgi:hypothetical protein
VVRGDAAGEISLTFDDGPDPQVTPAVLEVLRRHAARATFFVLTEHAFAHPDLVRRILGEGHEIGLHFDRHDRITELPPRAALSRMRAARRRLAELAGPVRLFRPPYDSQNLATYLFARSQGLDVIGWSQVADDWIEQSAERRRAQEPGGRRHRPAARRPRARARPAPPDRARPRPRGRPHPAGGATARAALGDGRHAAGPGRAAPGALVPVRRGRPVGGDVEKFRPRDTSRHPHRRPKNPPHAPKL